jgi:hypothetical protein
MLPVDLKHRSIEGHREMMNPGLPPSLWTHLEGKLWHATGSKGLAGIVTDGQIKVSTADQYQNSFCRCRGCVSLFDFGEESDDQDDFMRSNWFPWLGREHEGRCTSWLEIDRHRSASQLMSPIVVLETVRSERFRGDSSAAWRLATMGLFRSATLWAPCSSIGTTRPHSHGAIKRSNACQLS